jgi:hypothetical protein
MTFIDTAVIYIDDKGDLYVDTEGQLYTLGPIANVTDEGVNLMTAEVLRVIEPDVYSISYSEEGE